MVNVEPLIRAQHAIAYSERAERHGDRLRKRCIKRLIAIEQMKLWAQSLLREIEEVV